MIDLLIHLGYLFMLCALLARDILWLRGLLVLAQGSLAAYAWTHALPAMTAWNAVFVTINACWMLLILRERHAVQVPAALRALHQAHFAALPPAAFLRFWNAGSEQWRDGGELIRAGSNPEALYFLLDGQVRVQLDGRELARLTKGSFVGEMSLLSGDTAAADVVALGPVRLRAWPLPYLHELPGQQPLLWSQVQSVIGYDIVEKIRRSSAQGGAAAAGSSGVALAGAGSSGSAGA